MLLSSSKSISTSSSPYRTFSQYMHELFGVRVFKVAVDAGFSCPNRDGSKGIGGCNFCDERGSSSRTKQKPTIRDQILNNINFRANQKGKPKKFIVHFQSFTNTHADVETLENIFDQTINLNPDIVGLSISTRSDSLDFEKLHLIDSYRRIFPYVCIELGMQSIYDKTLHFYNRQETHQDFLNSYQMIVEKFPHLDVAVHVILGSPTESYEEIMKMASYLNCEIRAKGVKLHLLAILKKTLLYQYYLGNSLQNSLHNSLENSLENYATPEKAVKLIADFIERLPVECVIHRLAGYGHAHDIVYPQWLAQEKDRLSQKVKIELLNRRKG
ncbi:MAG: TIGR01212 family radical SAM protein [Oligoflexia bacterium]|nr:TIGR01212 family radical SAM protein [Oligoflexia bacterium]